ncbi:ubiquitin carboxyl-terminal hydrolase [Colletotrichum karsti]|uniref:ubiquitinyl hydrolase 1 n=1 Tax=Colletotrichum karsti TaxID=1095194 RepID=A0A9P6LER6_9PEZI|nr:ubiquitin carboxyl-terminal hydrolase [Colletotrichum karsti]KAF9873449.1 ubiquitin carboxyl-terminal hydrolase [Colletotrichum karsti]
MVAADSYAIMSPPDSPPATQHWEGRAPEIKEYMAGKSGRLAPRWIHDLLHSELDVGSFVRIEWDLDAGCSRHTLVPVGNQSTADTANPGVLSCVCTTCNYHFIIRTAWDADRRVNLCEPFPHHFPPKETDFYLHHLVSVKQPPQHHDFTSHYHPSIRESLIAVEHFACSAPRCTFQVTAEISRPRLKREWVQLLIDQERILSNLKTARKESPERFADAKDEWCSSAPSTLNTYLRDLLDPKTLPRNISKRNKRFHVVFGEECYAIFRAVQFTEESIGKDGVPEPYFIPPTLEPSNPGTPTELNTLRAFVEDMQAEAESLITRNGGNETRTEAGTRIYKLLQCLDFPRNQNAHQASDAHRILGVLPDFNKALIFYAYKRQSSLSEQRRSVYAEALCKIAQETPDEDFQTQAVQELTMVGTLPTADHHGAGDDLQQQAYSFFSLQHTASRDAVISAYDKKVEHSPSQADLAKNMLQMIGRHRSDEIIFNHASGPMFLPMDLAAAYRSLDCDPEWPDEHVRMLCEVKINKNPEDKIAAEQTVKALEVIAEDRESSDLREAVFALRGGLQLPAEGAHEGSHTNSSGQPATARLDIPAGLKNIGNTCYLNSILQYLRTVTPLTNLLTQYPLHQLGQDAQDIEDRLLGGNKTKVTKEEAAIGRILVEELNNLLSDLDNTQKAYIQPSQRLANAVLLGTAQIKESSNAANNKQNEEHKDEGQKQQVTGAQPATLPPPPLPARPAPVPPKNVEHVEDTNMVNVTVDPVSGSASSVSSQTLVSMPDAGQEKDHDVEDKSDMEPILEQDDMAAPNPSKDKDVQMPDAESQALSTDEIVRKALETQKRSSGTDQQDVTEVMGNIITRLQASIRRTSTSADGVQLEPIMETLFVESVEHKKMPNQEGFNTQSACEFYIWAYPAASGPCTIHEGLSRNFDLQRAEGNGGDVWMYTSIKKLPPVLHIVIQRTQQNGEKNMNPVEVSEMLYLDRYMDTPEDSPLFKRRQKGWGLQKRLRELDGIPKTPDEDLTALDKFTSDFVCNGNSSPSEGESTPSLLAQPPSSSLSFAGEDIDIPTYTPESEPSYVKVDLPPVAAPETRQRVNQMRAEEVEIHKAELEALFSEHKQQAYRLHAVICHSGGLSAGHYWVWIHDFERDVWHKYNDEKVTVCESTDTVLETLNSNGDPYYLCYVQDEKKLDLVRVPQRHASQDIDGDVVLPDAPGALNDQWNG